MKASTIIVASVAAEEVEQGQSQELVPAQEQQPTGKVEKIGGKRFGYNYIFIKSYKESKKNDVVKCLYIKSLTNFGFCVIKEGTYGDTKDPEGRDIIDRLKWQKQLHEQLQDKLPMPRYLGHFEENGNYYLVIGHVKGKALQKVIAEAQKKDLRQSLINGDKVGMRFLDYLIQITHILEKLHKEGIVHRDATPNNYMITRNGKVALIDMEMSYSLPLQFPTPAFRLGTFGYMSPQQEKTDIPTTAEDIFALGAIILQIWSGVSPSKLTNESLETLTPKIQFFIPDRGIADLVTRCLLPQDGQRPDAAVIQQILHQYKTDLKYRVARPVYQSQPFTQADILTTVQNAIGTLASPLLVDVDKGWFANDITPPGEEDKHKLRKKWYASYHSGTCGVIYLLTQAKQAGLDITPTLPFVQKGVDLIKTKYINRIETSNPSLHFGSAGIAATLASAVQSGLIESTTGTLEWINQLLEKSTDSLNIIRGIAGEGLANLICSSFISPSVVQNRLVHYGQLIADKQESDGSWTHGSFKPKYSRKKKKKTTRGFAEGLAGTVYFLLTLKKHYPDAQVVDEVAKQGLQWLMRKAIHKNETIDWRSARGKELGYGWADGAAGIALTFIKAYEVSGQKQYKDYAVKTLLSLSPTITNTNIGQHHGLSGLGEVYLEAYHVFREAEWLQRAGWIAQVIMQFKKQHPKYGPCWLVEHERQPVAGFMTGNSGVLHFLLRYCYPDKIGFPLMP